MPTLISINEYPQTQIFLLNENWKETKYYELCCKSELWGCAFLVTLDKQLTKNANEAIVYILERLAIEGESWDETLQRGIDAENFVKFVLGSGYISHEKGWDISIDEFWINYEEINNGIFNENDFKIRKNGVLTEETFFIQKEEIHSATCFADKWNNRQYLVETKTRWGFFSWGTGA
jgi:hypothetical protein